MRRNVLFWICAALSVTGLPHFGNLTATEFTFTTLAGPTGIGSGSVDGPGGLARFGNPVGVAVDGQGSVFVADSGNGTIRRISRDGEVRTFAGLAGDKTCVDGPLAAARFGSPAGLVFDRAGNLFVTDMGAVRKISTNGEVSTLAGRWGVTGSANGTGGSARFNGAGGIAADGSGNLYLADTFNHTIRKITPKGVVTTFAGSAGNLGSADGTGTAAQFKYPEAVAVDASGNIFVADTWNHTIRKITPTRVVTTLAGTAGTWGSADGSGGDASFGGIGEWGLYGPHGITVDPQGTLYVADTANETIRKVTQDGDVTTLAGLAKVKGDSDGLNSAARFYWPVGLAVDGLGNLYVADTYNCSIRQVTTSGLVSTVAGRAGRDGSADGAAADARFLYPEAVACDVAGNTLVADTSNHTIRKISPQGAVSTLAGLTGNGGSADGTNSAARFYYPRGLAASTPDILYVADSQNHTVRQVSSSGVVTTLAGFAANPGSQDGLRASARFNSPHGLALDPAGNLFVADSGNHTIRKVTSAGEVTTFAGSAGNYGGSDGTGTAARFYSPKGLALDGAGVLYVADFNNHTIRKISPSGVVTTLAGSAGNTGSLDGIGRAARFNGPSGVALDSSGILYVTDFYNSLVRTITPAGVVSTLSATNFWFPRDGTGTLAAFDGPVSLAFDGPGNLYVVENSSHKIKVGAPNPCPDTPVIDSTQGAVGNTRQLDTSPQTAVSWEWRVTQLPPGSFAKLSATNVRNPTFMPDAPGNYQFWLAATNAAGRFCIRRLNFLATPGLALSSASWSNGVFRVSVPTTTGKTYSLQHSTSLVQTNWISLAPVFGNGSVVWLSDSSATNSPRFYRVLEK